MMAFDDMYYSDSVSVLLIIFEGGYESSRSQCS